MFFFILLSIQRKKNKHTVHSKYTCDKNSKFPLIIKKNYLHLNEIVDVLNFKENEAMFVSQDFYPIISFSNDKTLIFMFSVELGVEFNYEFFNKKIRFYFGNNNIFDDQKNLPKEGALLGEISLINDSTISIEYFQKDWINQFNKTNLKNGHLWFPTFFYCVSP
jgi:hypothetical protein